jgi:hypothetical protein
MQQHFIKGNNDFKIKDSYTHETCHYYLAYETQQDAFYKE